MAERKYVWFKVYTSMFDHGIRKFSELHSTKFMFQFNFYKKIPF